MISLAVTTAISPSSRIIPIRCTHASYLGGTGLRKIISISTNRMRPPSKAGSGSRLKTPTLMVIKATSSRKERSPYAEACEMMVAVPTGPLMA